MKNFKKIMALVIAAMMIVGAFNMGTFAATTKDSKITVTGLDEGDIVIPYQVIEWVGGSTGWAFKAPFTSLTAADLLEITGDPSATPPVAGQITYAMAKKISNLATGGTAEAPLAAGATTWEKDDPDPGLYMILVTSKTPGVVYNPIFVSCDFKTGGTNEIDSSATYSDNTSVAKKKSTSVKKTTSDSDQKIKEAIDSHVGEIATFDVETTIPVFLPSYKSPQFVINDKIETTGIEYQAGTLEVSLDGTKISATYDSAAGTYTATEFTAVENGKGGYTVTFDTDYLKNNAAPVEVYITYKGKVTNKATFNVNKDNNTVDVTYTNGPNNEVGVLRDRTNHYTFSLGADVFGQEHGNGWTYELVKVGVDEQGYPIISKSQVSSWHTDSERHPLEGATFGLYTDAGCSTLYTNDLYPNGAEFTTTKNGVLTFKGLAAGTYYLKETKSPSGYIKDDRIVEITIDAQYKDVTIPATVENGIPVAEYTVQVLKSYSVTVGNASIYDSTNDQYVDPANKTVNTYTFENDGPTITEMAVSNYKDSDVKNTEGIELPSTGGMGTTLFYAIGAILVLGAGILLVSKRRMSAY